MKAKQVAKSIGLKIIAGESGVDREVNGVYICDLLSWVMAHAKKGNVWITVQSHVNIVAVAALTEISCIIIPENIEIEPQTITKAEEEGIPILSSPLNSYEIVCKLNKLMEE